jgi:CheY-like chemotaxis protein
LQAKKSVFEWIDKSIEFEPATILVVDDVDFNRALARGFLRTLKFSVLEAKNGQEGVDIAKFHKPDLILMDIRMPLMNGYQAAEVLRSHEETKNIPCIAFTASSMKHDEVNLQEQFTDFLFKPITRNELVDCLMKHLPCKVEEKISLKGLESGPDQVDALNPAISDQKVLHQILKDLDEQIVPDLKELNAYLDADILAAMSEKLTQISRKFRLTIFDKSIILLKQAADNYDFELFSKEIERIGMHITGLKSRLK